jgi:hypothetical protein
MATTQELTERVEALEKAMAELHAQFAPPRASSAGSASKASVTKATKKA